ncbi:RNA polymerase, sigma 54 subunit, RpoN/SigL [Nostoc sp. DSM 114161]|jgi:RNA polymerase sigma-54 factor|uniref:RNA polymerase factor sigma-54 n=1 Tax=Nostoc sp. DSM 114161 TaxID=3440143 RepID=UPI0040467BD5
MNLPALSADSALETHLETQAVLYPTLRQLVQLLPWNHLRVREYLQEQAQQNPFLRKNLANREALLEDILPSWYEPITREPSLQEHLRGQISALNITSRQREALIYLTTWLLPSGYLEESPLLWAAGSSWSASQLEAVVPLLQNLDPPGVGARSLQECLLIQLRDRPHSLTTLLVRDYLEDVAKCVGNSNEVKYNQQLLREKLQQRLLEPPTLSALAAAIGEIQTLEPRPGRNFSYSSTSIVTPDLQAKPDANGWQISLVSQVSQEYCLDEEALATLNIQKNSWLESLLQQAQNLLTALDQWQENLLKVGQFLVERQQAFLASQDNLDLVPTPQQLVAQSLGLSDATISRIVRERYLLIGGQQNRILPLRSLCPPVGVGGRTPTQIQQLIMQLIQEETTAKPYSDEQLSQLLKLRFGVEIARRTVVKYRKLAGIDSSHTRKFSKSRNS